MLVLDVLVPDNKPTEAGQVRMNSIHHGMAEEHSHR
jgi:hypothetical protein